MIDYDLKKGKFRRGHRHAGADFIREEERHWVIAALVASAVIAAAGTAVTITSTIQQNEQQGKIAKAQQRQLEQEAAQTRETSEFEARQQRRKNALMIGQAQAVMAATGFDTSSGTPLIEQIDLVKQGELEALSIQRVGRINESAFSFDAQMAKYRRAVLKSSLGPSVASTGLQGAGTALSVYSNSRSRPSTSRRTVTSDWAD